MRDFWYRDLDPEVERVTEEALARLLAAGAVLIEGRLPGIEPLIERTTYPVQDHDVRPALAHFLEEYAAGITLRQLLDQASPDIRTALEDDMAPGRPHFVSDAAYAAARARYLPELRQRYRKYFQDSGVAAMVFPAVRVPPPRIGEESTLDIRGRAVPFDEAVARNIAPGSTAGIPGLVLPAGLTRARLPVALEFDAPARADAALLSLGPALEAALGPINAPPSP